jgi:hypothetical protein
MGAYVIGHNIAGYLPESDTYAVADWTTAWETFVSEAQAYADQDDEIAWQHIIDTVPAHERADVEQPSMLATVNAMLADDDARESTGRLIYVEDNDGRMIAFWIQWSDDVEPETDDLDN